jgi:plastocyanin
LILLDLQLTGCGGSSGGQDAGKSNAQAKPPAPIIPARTKSPASTVKPKEISIDNFTYNPPRLTVPVGTKVTWINQDDVPHTVTSSAKPRRFTSGALDTDDRYSHVFTKRGTYDYFCAVHRHMTGQIIVK